MRTANSTRKGPTQWHDLDSFWVLSHASPTIEGVQNRAAKGRVRPPSLTTDHIRDLELTKQVLVASSWCSSFASALVQDVGARWCDERCFHEQVVASRWSCRSAVDRNGSKPRHKISLRFKSPKSNGLCGKHSLGS